MTLINFILSLGKTSSPEGDIVLLLMGQSNASGYTNSTAPPAEYQGQLSGCYIWDGVAFSLLEYGVNNEGFTATDFGFELSMCVWLQSQYNKNIYLIKHAKSGSPIAQEGGRDDWNKASNELYADAQSEISTALAELTTPNIIASVWMQGERDARTTAMANAYQANLTSFINSFSADMGYADTKWVICRLSDQQRDNFSDPANTFDVVTAAQQTVANGNANYFLYNTDGFATHDGLHFSATSNITIGTEIAQKIHNELL